MNRFYVPVRILEGGEGIQCRHRAKVIHWPACLILIKLPYVQAHVLVDNALPCLLSAYASYVTRIESDYFLSPNLRLLLRVFALPAFKI